METMETKVNTTNETESAAHQTGMMDIDRRPGDQRGG